MKAEMQEIIIQKLYEYEFTKTGDGNLFVLRDKKSWPEIDFDNVCDRLTQDGLIRPRAAGGNYRITAKGILYAEENNLASKEITIRNSTIRTNVLAKLADIYETQGNLASGHFSKLIENTDISEYEVIKNLQLLDDLGYVDGVAAGSIKISHTGLDFVIERRKRTELFNSFVALETLNPQQRGREFQKLLSNLLTTQGWNAEEGVRTENEEIDIIFSKGREYFLIECKWEKEPIEAKVIREFFGKLSHRVDVKGCVISKSGFTSGAKNDAEEHASQKVILLFGTNDTNAIFNQKDSFESLLDKKYKALITRKKIDVE